MDDSGNSNVAAVPYIRVDMSESEVYTEKMPTRIFFAQGENGQLKTTYEPTDPVWIKSSDDFQVSVDTCALHRGWYWAVFCVSLKEIDDSKLKSIIFDVTSENMCLGTVYTKDYTCKTAIQRDEIDLLPKTKFARLRLHRQIEVSPGTPLSVSMQVEKASGCEEVVPLDLHYFELACHDTTSEDHILWGEGKPDQFIRMGNNAASYTRPIAIEAYDISPTGKLAITMYFSPADSNVELPEGPRNPGPNFVARRASASVPACTPDDDRSSDRACTPKQGSTYTPEYNSAHTVGQGSIHDPDHAPTHGSTHNPDHAPTQGSTHGFDQAPKDGSIHGPNYAPTHGSTHGPYHAHKDSSTHGPDHAPKCSSSNNPDHAPTHGSTHDPDHAPKEGSTHGPYHAPAHGLLAPNSTQGSARTSTASQVSSHATDNAHVPDPHRCSTHEQVHTPTANQVRSQTLDNALSLHHGQSHTSSSTFTFKVAHIEVWDVSVPSGQLSSENPQAITEPLATLSFRVHLLKAPPGDDTPEPPMPTISISSTGLHIIMAVGWETRQVHATPFLIYRAEQNPPVTYDYKRVLKTCQSIQKFYGYGAFHHTDQVDPKPENERYFNFHGSNFDVYSTNGGWKQLYSLSFGINGVLHGKEMFYLYQSLRGRYFAWTGDIGTVSIWDFEKGKFVTTILIPKDTRGVCAALSEDGSMVAITVNGRIQVHDVVSGIKLGFRKAQWKEDNGSEIIFKHDYFMALDAERSTSGKKNIDARSIFRVRDMKIVKTHFVPWEYRAEFASTVKPMFSFQQGAILNIKRLGDILCPTEDNGCAPDILCEFQSTELNLINNTWGNRNQSSTGTPFVVGPDHSPSDRSSIMRLLITNMYNNTSLSLGPENSTSFGFFVAASSQLVLILSGFLQVWRLPSENDQQYELVHVEAFVEIPKARASEICITKVSSVQSCIHGRKFIIEIQPIQWRPDPKKKEIEDGSEKQELKGDSEREQAKDDSDDEKEYIDSGQLQTLTFPRTIEDTFRASEKYRYEKGVASLLDTYADSESGIKDAIIRFLIDRIRPSSKYSSSLVILCRSWKYGRRAIFEELIAKLLPDGKRHTWIPDINATKKEDPLSVLVRTAKNSPSALKACKIIMDYCVNHAIGSKNLAFLSPLLRNVKKIMTLSLDEARLYLRKTAYIPVSDRWREYIVEHSTVMHSPWYCLMRYSKTPLRLDKLKKPVMQLHVTPERPRNKADTFHRPIYAAAFDALWHFKHIDECEKMTLKEEFVKLVSIVNPWAKSMKRSTVSTARRESKPESVAPTTVVPVATTPEVPVATTPEVPLANPDGLMHQGASKPQETNWWKTCYHMFRLKCNLRAHAYVTCHDFSLEFLDNPAIAALVAYKWNTLGFAYWAFRFFFQCVFYVLVFAAALLQVYHENVERRQLGGVFVAVIAVGAVFLWLELWQATKNFKRYIRDPYNYLDIVAYSLPMAASFIMLMILCDQEVHGNTRILSYSVLAVFMHMLFELRIYKSVCKYITIIRRSVLEIRVFFLIFAGGLLAFTVALLHVLRACPVPGLCNEPDIEFSKYSFFGALSATYFFMGGRFDSVTTKFQSDDWTFHIMLAVYFFFTVIIMLNVLIALINKAFTKGDDDWRQDWIKSRMHYIELAENLSYHIPGFRETHNWFPKEIYYCATAQEVEEYEKKIKSDPAVEALQTEVQNLKTQLTTQQKQAEQQFKELKGLLLGLAGNSKTTEHAKRT